MKTEKADLLTAGAIAQKLGKPVPQVKQAITNLKLKPTAKKGVCSYYSTEALTKIKSVLK
jgi:hypothetical protein